MSDSNPDLEKVAKLESFRDEIKKLKVENQQDGTLMEIRDFGELVAEDMGLWQEYKTFFNTLDKLFSNFSSDRFLEKKDDLLEVYKTIKALIEKIKLMIKSKPVDHESAKQFLGWLNNRLTYIFTSFNLLFDEPSIEEGEKREILDEIKQDFLLNERKFVK